MWGWSNCSTGRSSQGRKGEHSGSVNVRVSSQSVFFVFSYLHGTAFIALPPAALFWFSCFYASSPRLDYRNSRWMTTAWIANSSHEDWHWPRHVGVSQSWRIAVTRGASRHRRFLFSVPLLFQPPVRPLQSDILTRYTADDSISTPIVNIETSTLISLVIAFLDLSV